MKKTFFALGLLALAALPSQADTFTFASDTLGAPTFNRPVAEQDYPLTPDQVTLSDVATEVPYYAAVFSVSLAGAYDFSAISSEFDTYIALYSLFDPAAGASNVIAVNDDGIGVGSNSGLSGIVLAANTTYTFVTTGFSNADFGASTSSISGPGTVTPVPEPRETAILLMAAVGLVVVFRMRRRMQA